MSTKISSFPCISLLSVLLSLSLVSCSLDENPQDQVPEEKAYTSATQLYLNTVATLYNYIGGSKEGEGLQGTGRGVYDLQTFGSDEAILPTRGGDWFDGGIWEDMYMHSWDAGHEILNNSWLYLYKVITLCNHSLEQLEAHQSLLSKEKYASYKAEVRALRAIYYWYLLDLFARVPIITSTAESMKEIQQSDRSEVFKFVIADLQEALPDLKYANSVSPGDYYGRVTHSVALFVLAKLMLNAEIYADDNWTDGIHLDGKKILFSINGQTMNAWEATTYYCNLLELSGFSLESLYINNFAVRNEYSKENIWVIPLDKDLYRTQQQDLVRSLHYRHAAAYGFVGENGTSATKYVLKVFEYNTPTEDQRFEWCYWAGQIRDLNYNIITDRTGQPLIYYPWEVKKDLSGGQYVETAGARMRKYEIDKNSTLDGKLMDNDIVLFRFADVLLMRAEAKLRNGEDGHEDFLRIRKRVGMPDRELTLQNLYDERLMELCWEGWRRQDMIRFRQYKSLYTGDDIDPVIDESDGHTTVFPIPGNALIFNDNLTQNPGY